MDVFGEKVVRIMNHSALGLMISVGYRAGLFETMNHLYHATTSERIAEAAKLNERYVREWLGAMTTGGIVDVDETGMEAAFPTKTFLASFWHGFVATMAITTEPIYRDRR